MRERFSDTTYLNSALSSIRHNKEHKPDINSLAEKISKEFINPIDSKMYFGELQPHGPRDLICYHYFINLDDNRIGREVLMYNDSTGITALSYPEGGVPIIDYYETLKTESDRYKFIKDVQIAYKQLRECNRRETDWI